MDSEFAGTDGNDDTGRFIHYWNRIGGLHLEPCVEYEDGTTTGYYTKPRSTKKETVMEPIAYEIGGRQVTVVSACVPIKFQNQVIGVTGIDFSMEAMTDMVLKINPYASGYGALITETGAIIVNPVNQVVAGLYDIAKGGEDTTKRLKVMSGDEIGELAKAFNRFMGKLQNLIKTITTDTFTVDDSAASLVEIAGVMSSGAEDTSRKSGAVATATEEMTSTIASAVEEQSIATTEISGNISNASTGISEVGENMSQVSAASDEIASEIAFVSTASEEMSSSSGQVNDKAVGLSKLAGKLKVILGTFKA